VAASVAYGLFYFDMLPWWGLLLLALGAGVVNIVNGRWIEERFGRKDPGACVIDECAGQWLTLLPLTMFEVGPSAGSIAGWFAIGFLLFRFFDIVKPLGARRLEALPHGWGILMDDVLCGVYGAAALTGLLIAL